MKPTILAEGPYRFVKLIDRSETSSHALVIATGVSYRKLDVAGIEKFTGAGVHYGIAMVQALSCKGENAYIDGGANSAGQAAIHFSKYSSKVIMLVRLNSLTKGMSQYLVDQINETKNIDVMRSSSNIEAVKGEDRLESVIVYNSKNEENTTFLFHLFSYLLAHDHEQIG